MKIELYFEKHLKDDKIIKGWDKIRRLVVKGQYNSNFRKEANIYRQ